MAVNAEWSTVLTRQVRRKSFPTSLPYEIAPCRNQRPLLGRNNYPDTSPRRARRPVFVWMTRCSPQGDHNTKTRLQTGIYFPRHKKRSSIWQSSGVLHFPSFSHIQISPSPFSSLTSRSAENYKLISPLLLKGPQHYTSFTTGTQSLTEVHSHAFDYVAVSSAQGGRKVTEQNWL